MLTDDPDSVNQVRRFPLPWTIEETESCFYVRDADGKRFGYCYFYPGEGRTSGEYLRLYRAEALRIVRNIAKLPEYAQKK